jgi:tetratricopeptide (TPR) repeat protein
MSEAPMPVEVFCSYAHEDEAWLRKLETHLSLLKRQGLISLWHDRLIAPGTDWAQTIDTRLETASVILLLVSADFIASDYCYGVEMQRALARQEAGEARVIPILVRATDWHSAPFARCQALPTNAQPLATWQDEDTALADVAAGLRRGIEDLPLLAASAPRAALSRIWNIPYPHNPFFLGREDLLILLSRQFHAGQPMALLQVQAISGLGGVGKTQLAIEYAYHHAQEYQAILWTRADSRDALVSGFVEIARVLNLSERDERDQTVIVEAVKRWLSQHTKWLLILDNADQPALVTEFLPSPVSGHVLLTTRAHAMGRLANRIEVDTLDPDPGALVLLRRAGLLSLDVPLEQAEENDRLLATQLCQELSGLPLALDQAGAYIEETQCSLQEYLDLYRSYGTELLRHRGGIVEDHPNSVATTWSLSFAAIEQRSATAADLLRLCAFLHPDAIPEELFLRGTARLGPTLISIGTHPLTLNTALSIINSYSLLRRKSRERTLSVHRLVQAVLRDTMAEQEQEQWLLQAIAALDAVFPNVTHEVWGLCERLLPHVLTCAAAVASQKHNPELASLLYKTAHYLCGRAQYEQAEPLFQRALYIREQALGPEHPLTAYPLNGLAELYREQGKYAEAEPLFQRALHIREQALGPEHPDAASTLNGLAELYREQGKYEQAEPLYQRALHIREQALGPEHLQVAYPLNGLAILYKEQGKYAEAEPLLKRALHIWEQALGPEHPQVAHPLNNLAILYKVQGKYAEAELLYQRALYIGEQALGPEHPQVAHPLNNLAELYREQGKYAEAEPLLKRALHIWEQALGPEHLQVSYPLNGLATLYREQGKYAEAEPLYRRALHIREQALGPEYPQVAYSLNGLAILYKEQGKYEQAEPLYRRALRIREQQLGSEHLETAEVLHDFAFFQEAQGNLQESLSLYQRALAIRERVFGPHHPKTRETQQCVFSVLGKQQSVGSASGCVAEGSRRCGKAEP